MDWQTVIDAFEVATSRSTAEVFHLEDIQSSPPYLSEAEHQLEHRRRLFFHKLGEISEAAAFRDGKLLSQHARKAEQILSEMEEIYAAWEPESPTSVAAWGSKYL